MTDFDLLPACAAAVERRAAAGWPQAARATQALDVARADYRPLDIPAAWPERFGLDDVDLSLLEIAAAVDRDPLLHLLLGLLSGDPGPGRPTTALALELAGISPADPAAYSRLGPLAALQRHRLLAVPGTDGLTYRRLRVPDRVAAQLRGDDLPDPAVLRLLVDPVPMRLAGSDRLAAGLAAGEQLCWIPASGTGAALAMAAGACHLLDLAVLVGDLRRLRTVLHPARTGHGEEPTGLAPDPEELSGAVAALIDEAALTGSVLVLMSAELAVGSLELLFRSAVPVLAISAQPWDPTWANHLPLTVTAPKLTIAERTALWERLLSRPVPREIAGLRLRPEQIRQVVQSATDSAALDGLPAAGPEQLRTAVRRLGMDHHRGDGVRIGDLVLPESAENEVRRLINWVRYRDEVMSMGPLQGKGKGTGICALFAGAPGTGKTLAADVVAGSLGLDVVQVELNSVVSKYIGETEKNLERIFTEAESLNAVLFFDEADVLFGPRSHIKDAHDRYANQEVAYLLQRMESFDGITILASNLRGNIDPAFARRLHFVITFPNPDARTRTRLWEHHLRAMPDLDPADPIDTVQLGFAVELSGGDIRNVVLAAAYDAVIDGQAMGMRHVRASLVRELTKLGRRAPSLPTMNGSRHREPPVGLRTTN
jgi:AAA+ superfamily predicted ATPase